MKKEELMKQYEELKGKWYLPRIGRNVLTLTIYH